MPIHLKKVLKEAATLAAKAAEGRHVDTRQPEAGRFDFLKVELAQRGAPEKREIAINVDPRDIVSKCWTSDHVTYQHLCDPSRVGGVAWLSETPFAAGDPLRDQDGVGTTGCIAQKATVEGILDHYPREGMSDTTYDGLTDAEKLRIQTLAEHSAICQAQIAAYVPQPVIAPITPTSFACDPPKTAMHVGIGIAVGFAVIPVLLAIGGAAYLIYRAYKRCKIHQQVTPEAQTEAQKQTPQIEKPHRARRASRASQKATAHIPLPVLANRPKVNL